MKKLQKIMLGIFCLILIGALIAGCGGGSKNSGGGTNPTPTPSSSPSGDMVTMEINPTTELSALTAIKPLPATYKGFTFGSGVDFDNNSSSKTYSGDKYSGTYQGRIKLGGTVIGTNSITFTAKAGGKLDMIALSSSSSDSTRHLMVAPIVDGVPGTGVDLGTVSGSALAVYSFNIPADGEYIIYAEVGGINIWYINIVGIVESLQGPSPSPTTEPSASPSAEPSPSPSVEPSPSPSGTKIPFSDNFNSATSESLLTTGYKALVSNAGTAMYSTKAGAVTVENGAVVLNAARLVIGAKGVTDTTSSTTPGGDFDLSKPWKISFKIVAISGDTAKKFQVLVDNNTTGQANSPLGNPSRVYSEAASTLSAGQTLTVTSSVGSASSFIMLRLESGLQVTIDDLVIEYQ